MKFNKTVQVMQELGSVVVKKARNKLKNAKPYSHTTKPNTLYKDIDYVVTSTKNTVEIDWFFGSADDYWEFVDQGVKGSGGFTGSGKMRGGKTKFRFKKQNIAKGVVAKWIANKPLRLRGADGKFVEKNQQNIKSAAFLIGRAIAQRGLTRTLFFTEPYDKEAMKYEDRIVQAFADDLEIELEQNIKD